MLLNGDINVVKSDISFYFKLREMEDKTPVNERVNENIKRKLHRDIQEAKSEIEKLERVLKLRESENTIKKTENETIKVEKNVEELENESVSEEELKTVSTGNSFLSILRENEDKYKNHGVYLEDVIIIIEEKTSSKETKVTEDISETVSHGIYLEDISLTNVESKVVKKPTDVVSHGVYIDEVEIVDVSKKESKGVSSEAENYKDHGVYLEDIVENTTEEEVIKEEDSSEEYTDEEENYNSDEHIEELNEIKRDTVEGSIDDLLDELFNEYSNKDEDIENKVEEKQEENKRDDIEREERERRRYEERERRHEERERRRYEERERRYKQGREDTRDWNQRDYIEERERRYQQERENTQEESIEVVEPKKQEEIIVVPTNIRDFIKSNQGCSSDYVLKYYSKKDLSKAITMGKIYTKNGKLYV